MAQVVYPARLLDPVEGVFASLRDTNPAAAAPVAAALQSAVETLAAHPLLGRRLEGELRELVVSYGKTGYVALYRFVISRDEVRILALRSQKELGYVP